MSYYFKAEAALKNMRGPTLRKASEVVRLTQTLRFFESYRTVLLPALITALITALT